MSRSLCLVSCLLLTVVAFAGPSWRSCGYCRKVIDDTNGYYGANVTSVTDVEFWQYFQVRCPNYRVISPVMSVICEDMISNHPKAVFNGLRSLTDSMKICQKCDDCY